MIKLYLDFTSGTKVIKEEKPKDIVNSYEDAEKKIREYIKDYVNGKLDGVVKYKPIQDGMYTTLRIVGFEKGDDGQTYTPIVIEVKGNGEIKLDTYGINIEE